MFYKWLLTHWITAESNNDVNIDLNRNSTLVEVYAYLKNNYSPHLHYVHGEDIPFESITIPNKSIMHKCEKIVLWFNGYYFPILSKPTFGPAHTPGDPMNTNGLEGQNGLYQNDVKANVKDNNLSNLKAFVRTFEDNTKVPDDFRVRPFSNKKDWNEVFKHCQKPRQGNVELPPFFRYMVAFEMDGYTLIQRDKMISRLTAVGKGLTATSKTLSHEKGVVVYLPTKHNFEITMRETKEMLLKEKNVGGYPSGSSSGKTCRNEMDDMFSILFPIFMSQLIGEYSNAGI